MMMRLNQGRLNQGLRTCTIMLAVLVLNSGGPTGPTYASAGDVVSADEQQALAAAVALNYSRASLHRIRRNPSLRVMIEEQEKILNHLNLNGVADEEVIRLYSSVLDEIGQIQMADQEKQVLKDRFQQAFAQEVTLDAFTAATQLTSGQFGQAVRTGASSWWDYRNLGYNRDLDTWRVEKSRLTAVVEKSTQFLDVSWKMARSKKIPDRWLVRGDDLDNLEAAWKETDHTVRLRILKRMESFMEAYPPYWYYVGRTQQALGQATKAIETYERLAQLAEGHFRKDEMLATALANEAALQANLGLPQATQTAMRALQFSTEAWEANLLCAAVLQRGGQVETAEDAILRNLDLRMERAQSQLALVSLYFHSDQKRKLATLLDDPAIYAEIPGPVLVSCMAYLGENWTSEGVKQYLAQSLSASPRFNFAKDDLVVTANSRWQLHRAHIVLSIGDQQFDQPRFAATNQTVSLAFEGISELGHPLGQPSQAEGPIGPVVLTLEYPGFQPMKLLLATPGKSGGSGDGRASLVTAVRKTPQYRLTAVAEGKRGIVLSAKERQAAKPVIDPSLSNPITLLPPLEGEKSSLLPAELIDAELGAGE